jgi:hypothetical protein
MSDPDDFDSMNPAAKWSKVPDDLKGWFNFNGRDIIWNGEAVLTLTHHKMEELRARMKNEYLINVKIDADVIYYLIDRIYHLEKRVKNLEDAGSVEG